MLTFQVPLGAPPRIFYLSPGPVPHPDSRTYRSPTRWYFHLYSYRAKLTIDGQEFALAPGTISLIAPGSVVRYDWPYPDNLHLFAHFECELAAGDLRVIPAVLAAGRSFPRLWSGMEEAIAQNSWNPRAAQARVWDLLWQIAGLVPDLAAGEDPLVTRALAVFHHAGAAARVSDLAQAAGVSADTLNRHFQAAFGLGVKDYLQRELAARIVSLIQDHGLTPAAAARELRCPNLHAFNKLVRRLCGAGPQALHRHRSQPAARL